MMLDEAITRACAEVGIQPPRGAIAMRRWVLADTLDGKKGKGDGRIICDDERVTAFNWKTGDKATVWLKEQRTAVDRKRTREQIAKAADEHRRRAEKAAATAVYLMGKAKLSSHPYLARKGFPDEQAPVVSADIVRDWAGRYLVPEGAGQAIVIGAKIGDHLSSAQLIWEDGTKKFLAGGEMGGAVHRIASGRDTWLCEGFATGLSLRAVLAGLNRRDTILLCFSASNIARVASSIKGRRFIAADNDKPMEQFGGLGTGEHYARQAGPYIMPPYEGMDINDMHRQLGIFAVQRLVSDLVRRAA